jgi:hypothetical protein
VNTQFPAGGTADKLEKLEGGTMRTVYLTLIAAMTGFSMFGDVIISDTPGSGSLGTDGSDFAAVQFTLTSTFTNVEFQVPIKTFVAESSGEVYLTNKLGTGATTANIVAENAGFSTTNSNATTLVNVFTNITTPITLGPGTYFLAIDELGGALGWLGSTAPAQTLDTGVTQGPDLDYGGTVASPPIASAFSDRSASTDLLFTVTGTPVQGVSGTPEPRYAVIILGLAGLGVVIRRNRRMAIMRR